MRETVDALPVVEPLRRIAEEFRALAKRPRPLSLATGSLAAGLPQRRGDVAELKSLLDNPTRGLIWARVLELTAAGGYTGEE